MIILFCFIELIAKLWQLIQPDPQGLAINPVGPGRLALFFSFFSRLGGVTPQGRKKAEKSVTACQANSISTSISISIFEHERRRRNRRRNF